jgi:hypothetical protein
MSVFKKVDFSDDSLEADAFKDEQVQDDANASNEDNNADSQTDDNQNTDSNQSVDDNLQNNDPAVKEWDENSVIDFLKTKYGKDINSLDDLLKEKEEKSIPEDVKKYLEYKEQTGRSYSDFMETQRDWEKENPDYVLKKYLLEQTPYLDSEEVNDEFNERFVIDEDYDDEKTAKAKKRELKKTLSEAISYFNQQKQQYAVARFDESVIPTDYKVAKETLDNLKFQQDKSVKEQEEKQKVFTHLTDGLFSDDFKGFDFNVSGAKQTYNVLDVAQVKETQKDISNFIGQFVDENGTLKNAAAYHKALYAAMNADKIAEHFYELGKANAIKNEVITSKNIDMGQKEVASANPGSGPIFRVLK